VSRTRADHGRAGSDRGFEPDALDRRLCVQRGDLLALSDSNSGKIGMFSEKQSVLLDRRIAVAPMMDWTGSVDFSRRITLFLCREIVCLLYVSSAASA